MAASAPPTVPGSHRQLPGSEQRPGPTARPLGPADDTETFTATIALRRRGDGDSPPDPSTYVTLPLAQPRRFSRQEFASRYGADDQDIAAVTSFAKEQGLTVEAVNAARRAVVLSGTVAQFSRAFAVKLGYYEHEVPDRSSEEEGRTERYRGCDGFIHVPAHLVDVIVAVLGLDNRRMAVRAAADPPGTVLVSVAEATNIYGFPSNRATGQTIAIFSLGGHKSSDITANFGGDPPAIIDVPVDSVNSGQADPETTQDIIIAGSAAPGADIAVFFTIGAAQGWFDVIGRVIDPDLQPDRPAPVCSVLSSSWLHSRGDDAATLSAAGISTGVLSALSQQFQDAAIQGVTVCVASGDKGSESYLGDGKAHVAYPASDPWVLSVGGTTLGASGADHTTGPRHGWQEWAWNDTSNVGTGEVAISYATGGGVSDFFPLPSYQTSAGVPPSVNDGHRGRGVPDVGANASPNSGYPITLDGFEDQVAAGTSAAAPLWAGLIAVLNAALARNVGYLNPLLYTLGNSVCTDILPHPGADTNSLFGVPGYPVVTGWDACTGWGSPDGAALLKAIVRAPKIAECRDVINSLDLSQ
jgi:kumamolisin